MSKKQGKVLLYEGENGNVELRVDGEVETVWATQTQISDLFTVDVRTVNEHLQNIFKSEELDEVSVIRKSRITAKDGKEYNTNLYNLDAIIAVGYRVNSRKATKFRIWATGILRRYILEGFSLNRHKLIGDKEGLEDVYDALDYIEYGSGNGKIKGKITVRITKDLTS